MDVCPGQDVGPQSHPEAHAVGDAVVVHDVLDLLRELLHGGVRVLVEVFCSRLLSRGCDVVEAEGVQDGRHLGGVEKGLEGEIGRNMRRNGEKLENFPRGSTRSS